jgi:hypothetical protein
MGMRKADRVTKLMTGICFNAVITLRLTVVIVLFEDQVKRYSVSNTVKLTTETFGVGVDIVNQDTEPAVFRRAPLPSGESKPRCSFPSVGNLLPNYRHFMLKLG